MGGNRNQVRGSGPRTGSQQLSLQERCIHLAGTARAWRAPPPACMRGVGRTRAAQCSLHYRSAVMSSPMHLSSAAPFSACPRGHLCRPRHPKRQTASARFNVSCSPGLPGSAHAAALCSQPIELLVTRNGAPLPMRRGGSPCIRTRVYFAGCAGRHTYIAPRPPSHQQPTYSTAAGSRCPDRTDSRAPGRRAWPLRQALVVHTQAALAHTCGGSKPARGRRLAAETAYGAHACAPLASNPASCGQPRKLQALARLSLRPACPSASTPGA